MVFELSSYIHCLSCNWKNKTQWIHLYWGGLFFLLRYKTSQNWQSMYISLNKLRQLWIGKRLKLGSFLISLFQLQLIYLSTVSKYKPFLVVSSYCCIGSTNIDILVEKIFLFLYKQPTLSLLFSFSYIPVHFAVPHHFTFKHGIVFSAFILLFQSYILSGLWPLIPTFYKRYVRGMGKFTYHNQERILKNKTNRTKINVFMLLLYFSNLVCIMTNSQQFYDFSFFPVFGLSLSLPEHDDSFSLP